MYDYAKKVERLQTFIQHEEKRLALCLKQPRNYQFTKDKQPICGRCKKPGGQMVMNYYMFIHYDERNKPDA